MDHLHTTHSIHRQKISHYLIVILTLVLFPLCGISQEVSLKADRWMPFNGDPSSPKPGYVIEIVNSIFSQHNIKLSYELAPWNRVLEMTKSGTIDGAICASKGDAPYAIFPEEPVGVVTYSIFSASGVGTTIDSLTALESITLDVVADYSYGPTLDRYIEKNKRNPKRIQFVYGDEPVKTGIEKLIRGRATHFAQNKEVFFATVDEMKLQRAAFNEHWTLPEKDPLYIAFSPNKETSKHYAQILSEGIRSLRTSGALKKILDRYEIQDWK